MRLLPAVEAGHVISMQAILSVLFPHVSFVSVQASGRKEVRLATTEATVAGSPHLIAENSDASCFVFLPFTVASGWPLPMRHRRLPSLDGGGSWWSRSVVSWGGKASARASPVTYRERRPSQVLEVCVGTPLHLHHEWEPMRRKHLHSSSDMLPGGRSRPRGPGMQPF